MKFDISGQQGRITILITRGQAYLICNIDGKDLNVNVGVAKFSNFSKSIYVD